MVYCGYCMYYTLLDLYNMISILYPKIKVHPGSAWLLAIMFYALSCTHIIPPSTTSHKILCSNWLVDCCHHIQEKNEHTRVEGSWNLS